MRTSFGLRRRGGTMYQRKVDVDMLNAVKSVLADVSSVSPSSEQRLSIDHQGPASMTLDSHLCTLDEYKLATTFSRTTADMFPSTWGATDNTIKKN